MTARKPRNQPRRIANRTPPAIAQRRILAWVKEHGECRTGAIASALKFTRQTVLKYTNVLCGAGLLHHIVVTREGSSGVEHLFRPGPAPDIEDAVHQTAVKAWAPMRIVDPWMLPREFFGGARP